MRRVVMSPVLGLTIALAVAATFPAQAATLESAAEALGAAKTKSLEFAATGHWFQFGQAPAPSLAWPRFNVSNYTADINYDTSSARVQITRKQSIEPKRQRPVPVEQRLEQFVSGGKAWNLAPPANAPQGTAAVATPQPAAIEERNAEIWATPQGFLKAALANNAVSKPAKGGVTVSFTVEKKYRYVGTINAKNQVERVQTWIANPVLGDTLIETRYAEYQ